MKKVAKRQSSAPEEVVTGEASGRRCSSGLRTANGRVIGSVGYSRVPETKEAVVHRLYVKASLKHRGVGTALLQTAEEGMRRKGITLSRLHLGEPKEQWFESYAFYPKHGYREIAPRCMIKEL